jgi:F-type H+-transporting ATP synthase subunit e
LGIFYGFSHQRSITTTQKEAETKREYEHKQALIKKAKDAYAKSQQPAASSAPATAGEWIPYLSPPSLLRAP